MRRNIKIKFVFISFFLLNSFFLFPQILNDITSDHEITIRINESSDDTIDLKEDTTDDDGFGNKWYSRQNIFIYQTVEMGMVGSKDFFKENFLFKYRFKSKNKHTFAIRLSHIGFSPGIFSGHFEFYNFSVCLGFEYLLKIFSNTEGFFVWSDFGGCNKGIAFDIGLGVGSRVKNGFEIHMSYLHNVGVFSSLDFYFLLFKFFTIRGKLGIDFKYFYNDSIFTIDLFNFHGGIYLGFYIKELFRFELGGGFTFNEYSIFSGFGGFSLAFNLL